MHRIGICCADVNVRECNAWFMLVCAPSMCVHTCVCMFMCACCRHRSSSRECWQSRSPHPKCRTCVVYMLFHVVLCHGLCSTNSLVLFPKCRAEHLPMIVKRDLQGVLCFEYYVCGLYVCVCECVCLYCTFVCVRLCV